MRLPSFPTLPRSSPARTHARESSSSSRGGGGDAWRLGGQKADASHHLQNFAPNKPAASPSGPTFALAVLLVSV